MASTTDLGIAAPAATRREWCALAVIALPCLLYSMDLSVLNLAIPQLTADLRPSASQLLWIVDIYGFLLAGFLLPMGTLGDRIGRRRLLVIGSVAFGAASVLAAFSTTAQMLIFSRAVLGLAAATLAPSTLSLIRNMFHDQRQRTLALSIWASCFAAGSTVGPLVGGVMLEHFWWGSVFLLALPVMLLVLLAAPRLLPEFRDPNAGSIDLLSSVQTIGAVLPVIYGIKRLADDGPDVWVLLSVALGCAVGVSFLRRQARLRDPMIDLRLFRSWRFNVALSCNVISVFAAFGSFLLISQYLQLVAGMKAIEAALWVAPSGLLFMLASIAVPPIVRRVRATTALGAALMLTALGYAVLAQVHGGGVWVVFLGFMLYCAGLAPAGLVATDLILSSVPAEKAGAASGISETSMELGAALGVAGLGSIVTAIYRAVMVPMAVPEVPLEAMDAARDTLAGAVATAQALGGAAGDALLAAARDAFTRSMQAAFVVSFLLSLIAAIVCLRLAKR